ncbi:protein of unknown function [Streptomyces murinus]
MHISSAPPPTASAHAWWTHVSGPGTKAKAKAHRCARLAGEGVHQACNGQVRRLIGWFRLSVRVIQEYDHE